MSLWNRLVEHGLKEIMKHCVDFSSLFPLSLIASLLESVRNTVAYVFFTFATLFLQVNWIALAFSRLGRILATTMSKVYHHSISPRGLWLYITYIL